MFVIFLTLLGLVRNNFIVWWRIFLLITLLFIMLNKSLKSYSSLFNYFIIQESLGLLFLVFSFGFFQFFIVIIKIGVAPLHFWVFNVINNVFGFNLIWFLTFQKLPFLVILLQIFFLISSIFLILGLLICYLQIFLLKGYKNLIIISSTESFNWIIIGVFFSFLNSLFLFFYYFILISYLISKYNKFDLNFVSWETVLVFLNLPFSVTFFVKIFSLSEILKFETIFIIVLLFLMFLSVLSFGFWLINIRVKSNFWLQNNNKSTYFIILPLIIISII